MIYLELDFKILLKFLEYFSHTFNVIKWTFRSLNNFTYGILFLLKLSKQLFLHFRIAHFNHLVRRSLLFPFFPIFILLIRTFSIAAATSTSTFISIVIFTSTFTTTIRILPLTLRSKPFLLHTVTHQLIVLLIHNICLNHSTFNTTPLSRLGANHLLLLVK